MVNGEWKTIHYSPLYYSPRASGALDFPSTLGGFPHSEILGSKLIRSSPKLIAAYHVLHRLCMPRHPPIALKTLDRSHCQCPSSERCHWHKKTSFSRSVREARLGNLIICEGLSVLRDGPCSSPPGRLRKVMDLSGPGSEHGTRTNLLFTMSCRTGGEREARRKLFSQRVTTHRLYSRMVEPDGIEPTTSCLQSTRSPS